MAGDDLVLLLGKIDDSDKAYLNGKLIGATFEQHDRQRIYHISTAGFKAGQVNTLVVYVEDIGGGGGMWEGPVGLMKQTDFTRYIRWR
jgi:sialate O-acetylesterase